MDERRASFDEMKKMKSAIWISYDLGVRGDYEGLYTWLDEHQAMECGDSLAFLNYEYRRSLKDSLTKELRKAFEITKQTRIYLMYRERETNKIRGRFIFGGRRLHHGQDTREAGRSISICLDPCNTSLLIPGFGTPCLTHGILTTRKRGRKPSTWTYFM